MTSKRYDVVIVGGDVNGLVAAIILARAGRKVLICESRPAVGGLAEAREFAPGFFAPGLLSDSGAWNNELSHFLKLESHGLRRHASDPGIYIAGSSQMLYRDPDKMSESLSSGDLAGYRKMRAFLAKVRPVAAKFFRDQPPKLTDLNLSEVAAVSWRALALRLLGKETMLELLRIAPMCTVDWLNELFQDQSLKAVFGQIATEHNFMGPRSPLSNVNLVVRESLAELPLIGGSMALIRSLQKSAFSSGVDIQTSCAISRIPVVDGRVAGVQTLEGETFESRSVLSTIDPKKTMLELLDVRLGTVQSKEQIASYRMRGTMARLNLAITGNFTLKSSAAIPEYLRTGQSLDDIERAFDPLKYDELPRQPVLEWIVPSVAANDCAPSGCHVMAINIHCVPYRLKSGWVDRARSSLVSSVLEKLNEIAPGLSSQIKAQELLLPCDIEREYNVTGGSIWHGEHALDQWLIRPTLDLHGYASPVVKGLYLGGSSSFPGGGLHGMCGRWAAMRMLQVKGS